jgi:hypothetical protein
MFFTPFTSLCTRTRALWGFSLCFNIAIKAYVFPSQDLWLSTIPWRYCFFFPPSNIPYFSISNNLLQPESLLPKVCMLLAAENP